MSDSCKAHVLPEAVGLGLTAARKCISKILQSQAYKYAEKRLLDASIEIIRYGKTSCIR